MRLNKFLAQSGATSRRKADEFIADGKVKVNGKVITEMGVQVDPDKDQVSFYDRPVSLKGEFIYLAINKPKGYITTLTDPFNRETTKLLIPRDLKRAGLKPIGRLDKDTEGLLIMTNDLELINELTHPKFEKEKEYNVKLDKPLSARDISELEKGIPLEDKVTLPCKIVSSPNQTARVLVTIKEGRKRQIRKMFLHLGYTVIYLQRIRIGKLTLGEGILSDLKIGKSKLITKECL